MFAILERSTLFLSSRLGKSYILVAGVIHTLREDQCEDEEWTKVKLVAVFDGPWRSHCILCLPQTYSRLWVQLYALMT